MAKAANSEIKKRKGRPGLAYAGIASVPIMVRLSPETVAEIDRAMADFAKKMAQLKGTPYATRQEWIRSIIGSALMALRSRSQRDHERKIKKKLS